MKNFFFIALIALELCGCQNNQSSNMGQTSSSQELSAQKQLQKGQETWSYIDNKVIDNIKKMRLLNRWLNFKLLNSDKFNY